MLFIVWSYFLSKEIENIEVIYSNTFSSGEKYQISENQENLLCQELMVPN